MKIYQPKTGPYTLPRSIYNRVIYLVKDYPRLIEQTTDIIAATPERSETPEIQRQRNIRATETANIRYSMIMKDIRDIEESLKQAVPPDARIAIMENIVNGKRYPVDRDRSTYSRYKQRFIYLLAERRNLI